MIAKTVAQVRQPGLNPVRSTSSQRTVKKDEQKVSKEQTSAKLKPMRVLIASSPRVQSSGLRSASTGRTLLKVAFPARRDLK